MAESNQKQTTSGGTGVHASLARHGGLSYLEIPAIDPRQSAAFYEKVVGWNVGEPDTAEPKFDEPSGHLIGRWVTGLLYCASRASCLTFTSNTSKTR